MLARQTLVTLLLAGQAGYTSAYNNGAPGSKLPVLGWSSWVALGPGEAHPIFDYCDEASVKAAADAFVAVGLKDAGYTGFHLDGTLLFLSHIPLPFALAQSRAC
jgi:hypothetical protein